MDKEIDSYYVQPSFTRTELVVVLASEQENGTDIDTEQTDNNVSEKEPSENENQTETDNEITGE
jgi:hypothetical protein